MRINSKSVPFGNSEQLPPNGKKAVHLITPHFRFWWYIVNIWFELCLINNQFLLLVSTRALFTYLHMLWTIRRFKINTPFSTQEVFVVDAVIGYQDVTSSSTFDGENVTTNVHWTGTVSDYLVTFDGGYQMILLPGGMYMGCPCDVAKSVAESKSFHLEFCWLETPDKRQRLVRTYDVQGLAVSSTYFLETKLWILCYLFLKSSKLLAPVINTHICLCIRWLNMIG